MRLADFFCGPGRTILAPDEALTGFRVPLPAPRTASGFLKLGQRRGMAIAVASVAVRLTLDERDRVSAARIVLGSVAPVPWRARPAELLLEGAEPSQAAIEAAAQAAGEDAHPITDLRASAAYRRQMVTVLTRGPRRRVPEPLNRGLISASRKSISP